MITREDLIASGYKPFTSKILSQYSDKGYQKCLRDEKGKKYYITLIEYDWDQFPEAVQQKGYRYSYAPETQFNTQDGTVFDLQMLSPESIEQMEVFFEDVWTKMNCQYYELYN